MVEALQSKPTTTLANRSVTGVGRPAARLAEAEQVYGAMLGQICEDQDEQVGLPAAYGGLHGCAHGCDDHQHDLTFDCLQGGTSSSGSRSGSASRADAPLQRRGARGATSGRTRDW